MKIGEVANAERGQWGKPLEGVRILAAEQMQALPYATQLLAHLGAEVVKIEPPGRGDTGRYSQPSLEDADGRTVGATYLRNNLNKRSICLDLKSDEGRALFRSLIPHFDVVAENFTPGVMARFGLDYGALKDEHPELIYVSISGFGHLSNSPYRHWPAYAPAVEAMAGIYDPTRKEGQPPPVVVAGALGDNAAALFTAIGILSALQHRHRTGLGQYVDVSMYDSTLAFADMIPQLHSMGAPPGWATAGSIAIVAGFRARDGWFVISCVREHHFERLVTMIGHPEWKDDPRFATREGWAREIEPTLRPAIEAWAHDKTRREACEALAAEGIAAGPSQLAQDIADDPHVAMRHMLIEVPRVDGEEDMLVVGNPVKLSRAQEGPVSSFPGLGEHTDEVLRETLGLDDDRIAELRERGVI